jgi:glucokinase
MNCTFHVYLGNDADAAGLAEALVGAGKGLRTVIYITLSTGIGGAIVYNGQLLPGSHGYSMEVASMSIDDSRPKINLPSNGAVEDWASGTSITRLGREKITDHAVEHAGTVFDLAEQGVGAAVAIVDQATTDLAAMFGNLATTIDPDCFILGGGMMKSAGIFLPQVKEKYKAESTACFDRYTVPAGSSGGTRCCRCSDASDVKRAMI